MKVRPRSTAESALPRTAPKALAGSVGTARADREVGGPRGPRDKDPRGVGSSREREVFGMPAPA
jgi:hypothetical protein